MTLAVETSSAVRWARAIGRWIGGGGIDPSRRFTDADRVRLMREDLETLLGYARAKSRGAREEITGEGAEALAFLATMIRSVIQADDRRARVSTMSGYR